MRIRENSLYLFVHRRGDINCQLFLVALPRGENKLVAIRREGFIADRDVSGFPCVLLIDLPRLAVTLCDIGVGVGIRDKDIGFVAVRVIAGVARSRLRLGKSVAVHNIGDILGWRTGSLARKHTNTRAILGEPVLLDLQTIRQDWRNLRFDDIAKCTPIDMLSAPECKSFVAWCPANICLSIGRARKSQRFCIR